MFTKLLAPRNCYQFLQQLSPWVLTLGTFAFVIGLVGGLAIAPADYQQGDVYRIMFIHVPAAFFSLAVYVAMSVSALIYLVWHIKVADCFAKVAAPIGALLTALTLITGAIWGRPTWGTYWIWDARLTSELILLFIYFGIMAMRSAILDRELASKATSFMIVVGLVNIPIVHYSVIWWHTLHQGPTLLSFAKPTIAPSMLWPLLCMLFAYACYVTWIITLNLRTELLRRNFFDFNATRRK